MKEEASHNEAARLEALRQYRVLDTAPEKSFDDLAALAAEVCDTPVALIGFLDSERVWLKAKIGLPFHEVRREVTFCSHVVTGAELMVVPDARQDDRFASHPFVTGEPHICFYAGVPLVTAGGHAIGTLCVMDRKPRQLSAGPRESLRALARQVITQLELRLHMERLEQAISERNQMERVLAHESSLLHSLMDNIPDTIYFKDRQSRFTRIDRAQAQILGVACPEDAIGKTDADFFTPEHARAALEDEQRLLQTGEPLVGKMEKIRHADGKFRWVTATKVPVRDKQGQIVGLVGISRDVTERVEAEEKVAAYSAALRERNLQMEADLVLAREVQEALLPQQFPSFPPMVPSHRSTLRFASRYQPCAMVGGDFLNVLRISDSQAGLLVCDVMGKGVRAALVTAMMRALMEELLPIADSPGRFLAGLNRGLVSILQERQLPMFASACYVTLDSINGEVRFANAGHPAPFYLQPRAGTVEPLRQSDALPGPVLGVFDNSIYAEGRLRIVPGDRIMLFTDGLYELVGPSDEEFGQERLREAVRQRLDLALDGLFDQLLSEVRAFSCKKEFSDDICLLGAEIASF